MLNFNNMQPFLKAIINKLFIPFIISFLLFPQYSCDTTEPTDNLKPGRRDYTWTVDTLPGLNNPRFRMWGSSPTDIWATTSSSWENSISHFNGSRWVSYGVTGLINPNAIYGFSGANVLIGAENGKIWKYNGNSWELLATLSKPNLNYFNFENIWGKSLDEYFAVGSGADEQGAYNKSVIAYYSNNSWEMLNTDAIVGDVVHLYKNQIDHKTYLRLTKIGGAVHIDSTIIYDLLNGTYKKIYSSAETKGLAADISLINNEVIFIMGNQIAKRVNNQFQTILNVNNSNFYQRIWGRNTKDIFLLMTDGLAHFNGNDVEYLFYFNQTPRTQIYGSALFEKDVFFLVDEAQYRIKFGLSRNIKIRRKNLRKIL